MKNFTSFREETLHESSLSRITNHIQNRNVGIISAHRGNLTDDENRANTILLKDAIRQHGFGHNVVHGVYTENKGTPHERVVHEHSYLVHGHIGDDNGKLKTFLTQQGARFNQDSILHKAHNEPDAKLIGTSHNSDWLKKGEESNIGTFHPNRVAEFHSALRNKKTFVFESVKIEDHVTYFLEQVKPE